MKHMLKSARPLVATLITFGSLAGVVSGAAVITFTESGGNVIATTSGTLSQPSTEVLFNSPTSALLGGSYAIVGSTTDAIISGPGGTVSGSFTGPAIDVFADTFTGPRIGASAGSARLLYGGETPWATPLTSTAVWNSTTFASLNLSPSDNFTLTYPILGGGSDTLTVQIVPEPSSSLVLGLSGLALMARRKRA